MAITFPNIDPVILHIGPFSFRWYSLSYIAGLVLGIAYIKFLLPKHKSINNFDNYDDLLFYLVLGIILGGRLGYILFYQPQYYLHSPLEILKLWTGGMSFHGGLIGVIVALKIFVIKYKLRFFVISDLVACATPIGISFGRLANFINGELYGRVTNSEWGMIFPDSDGLPRHPSQLYEAFAEGVINFLILYLVASRTKALQSPGILSGLFLFSYACARIICEFFRQPDLHIGYLASHTTMGQLLSIPMALLGLFLIKQSLPWSKTYD